jgi:thiamine biosynthesis lipoprotein
MGTVLEISLCAPERALGARWLDELFAEVARLERIFSRFDPQSDLSRVNARAGRGPVAVPPELLRISEESLALGRLSRGTFDIAVGPLVALWSAAGRSGVLPGESELERARACAGPELVRVDRAAGTLELARDCASLDLGGIAKGWTLDRLAEALRAKGVTRALLNFGGSSLAALGSPPDAARWGVLAGEAGELYLRDQSLSVSGSLGQTVEIAGRSYGHVVDPRTGRALTEANLAVVLAGSGTRAEVLSKALLVLGPSEGIALLESLDDAQGLIADERGERRATRGFDAAAGRTGG